MRLKVGFNQADLSRALRKLEDLSRVLDVVGRPMMGECGQYMVMSAKRNFAEERDPAGKPWKPLKPATIKRKGSSRILFDTGALNRSIQVLALDRDRVAVGPAYTEQKKGKWHQFGTEHIPARPFLGFSEPRNDVERLKQIVIKHLRRGVRRVCRA